MRNCGSATRRLNHFSCRCLGANWRNSTETFQFCTSLSARPESPRAISSAIMAKVSHFGALFEFDAAEFLRHAESADADLFGALQDAQRQPVFRHHRPFALPVLLDEGQHHIVDEIAAALPHHLLLFRQTPVVHVHNPSMARRDGCRARARSDIDPDRGQIPRATPSVARNWEHAMGDVQQVAGTISDALQSIGHEFTSVRLLSQFGLILLAAAIGTVAATLIRRRIDLNALTLGWPPFLQTAAKLLMANLGTIIFVLTVVTMRAAMISLAFATHPYLLGVAIALATAWVVIALVAGLIRNPFVYRLVAVSAWTIAALSILGLLAADHGGAQFDRLRDRRLARHAAAGDQDLGAADAHAVGGERGERLPRPARARERRPDAIDPGADRQADPPAADHLRHPDRAVDRSASTFPRSPSFPARSASASASACRRSCPIW